MIVDDGSKDGTLEKAMYFNNKLPMDFIILSENKGKWSAINEGLMASEGLILLLDADGSANVWQLEDKKEEELMIPKEGFAVFGSRFMSSSKVTGKSILRSIVSRVYKTYVKFWYFIATGSKGQYIDDMQCPFKLFWKEDLQLPLLTRRFSGDIELACRLKSIVSNVPIEFNHVRGSKVPISSIWNMFLETPKIALAHRFMVDRYYTLKE